MNSAEHYELDEKNQVHSKSGDKAVNQKQKQEETQKQESSDRSLTDLLRGVLSQNYNEKMRYEKDEIQ